MQSSEKNSQRATETQVLFPTCWSHTQIQFHTLAKKIAIAPTIQKNSHPKRKKGRNSR